MLETKSFLFGIASTCVPVTQKITGFPVCKTIYVSACMQCTRQTRFHFCENNDVIISREFFNYFDCSVWLWATWLPKK